MKRAAFAIAVAGLASVAVSDTLKAAPIAPLPEAVGANSSNVVQAYYYHHHYYRYHWHHHYYHHRHWHHRHWY
jgi:hypothetical protein